MATVIPTTAPTANTRLARKPVSTDSLVGNQGPVHRRRRPANQKIPGKVNHVFTHEKLLFRVVLGYAIERSRAITPTCFFAFFIGTTVVGNTDFVESTAHLCQPGSNFRPKSKTIFLDSHLLDNLPFKNLVTGFHICEIRIGKHIRQQAQYGISTISPVAAAIPARNASRISEMVCRSLKQGMITESCAAIVFDFDHLLLIALKAHPVYRVRCPASGCLIVVG